MGRLLKSRILLLLIVLVNGYATIYSGEIRDQFINLNEKDTGEYRSSEEKNIILEKNITSALRMMLLKYYSYCDYNNVKITNSNFERSDKNPRMFYIKYNDFLGYFVFQMDPEIYLQTPFDEKLIVQAGTKFARVGDENCGKNQPAPKSESGK